jgi:hypothetical protein
MPFNFNAIQSIEFGICLNAEGGEVYHLVPADHTVQNALQEMLEATRAQLFKDDRVPAEFSPAEKYSSTESLKLALSSELVAKHRAAFEAENLSTNTHGLDDPGRLVSYFAIFRDRAGGKLMGFRRAAQFKGVVKKSLITFLDDTLKIVNNHLFKLDTDFDFLIYDGQILIWRPSGFVFTAGMEEHIAACAAANVDDVSRVVSFVDFSGLKDFVSKHKLSMRLIAAIKQRGDLADISERCLKAECKEAGLKISERGGKLFPAEGSEYGFLMLLDRRRYTVTLIDRKPETYEAPSRHVATRAE